MMSVVGGAAASLAAMRRVLYMYKVPTNERNHPWMRLKSVDNQWRAYLTVE